MKEKSSIGKQIAIFFGIIIVLLLLFFLIGDWRQTVLSLKNTNWLTLVFSALPLLAGIILIVIAWQRLLPRHPKFWGTFHATSVGNLISILTPIPDAALRVVTTEQGTPISLTQATASMMVDRVMVTLMRIVSFIIAVSFFAIGKQESGITILISILLIGTALWLLFWIARHPEEAIAKISRFRRIPYANQGAVKKTLTDFVVSITDTISVRQLLVSVGFFLLIWLVDAIFLWFTLEAMPQPFSTLNKLAIIAAMLTVLPPAVPVMIGLYQGIAVGMLMAFKLMDSGTAVSFSIISQIPQVVCWLVLGIWGYSRTNMQFTDLLADAKEIINDPTQSDEDQST